MIVRFVDIGGIIDLHYLNCHFIKYSIVSQYISYKPYIVTFIIIKPQPPFVFPFEIVFALNIPINMITQMS